jgi:hypothetical protein
MIPANHEPSSRSSDRAASSSRHFTGPRERAAIVERMSPTGEIGTSTGTGDRAFPESLIPHLEALPERDLAYLTDRLREVTGRLPLPWLSELRDEVQQWYIFRRYQRTGDSTPPPREQRYTVADVAR